MGKIAFVELKYYADTWPLIRRRELTVTAEDRRVVCESETRRVGHRCNESEWRQLEELLSACDFPAWQEEYYEPVLDGTHWLVILLLPRREIADGEEFLQFPPLRLGALMFDALGLAFADHPTVFRGYRQLPPNQRPSVRCVH